MFQEAQLALDLESRARDRALDLIEAHHTTLVSLATQVAISIARANGCVTSTMVLQALKESDARESVLAADRRFMGAVFRSGKLWEHAGYVDTGSHRRNVSVWKLRGE